VYVSSDRSRDEFDGYYGGHMPWLAVPVPRFHRDAVPAGGGENKNQSGDGGAAPLEDRAGALSAAFGVRGIPTLVVLRRASPGADSWLLVTDRGREQVAAAASSSSPAGAAAALLDEWMSSPAVPVAEARNGAGTTGIAGLVAALLRHPAVLIGLYYLVAHLLRARSAGGGGGGKGPAAPEDPGPPAGAGEEPEF
jgi:hypothetical protein